MRLSTTHTTFYQAPTDLSFRCILEWRAISFGLTDDSAMLCIIILLYIWRSFSDFLSVAMIAPLFDTYTLLISILDQNRAKARSVQQLRREASRLFTHPVLYFPPFGLLCLHVYIPLAFPIGGGGFGCRLPCCRFATSWVAKTPSIDCSIKQVINNGTPLERALRTERAN